MRILSKRLLLGVLLFSILDVFFSFFAYPNSVFMQTLYGISKLGIFVYIILNLRFYDKQYTLIRNVLAAYWIGGIIIYLYAFIFYFNADVATWANNLNNLFVLIPIYTFSIIGAIIHTAWKR